MPSREEFFASDGSQHDKHWLPWLKGELDSAGIPTEIPSFPEPYEPDYEKWKAVFESFPIGEETMLIGHSCGGGFLIRWLSEKKVKVGKVALVAPWIDPTHAFASKMFDGLTIDPMLVSSSQATCIFVSLDDSSDILKSVECIQAIAKGIQIQEFSDQGHFTMADMKTEEFPQLKDFLLK